MGDRAFEEFHNLIIKVLSIHALEISNRHIGSKQLVLYLDRNRQGHPQDQQLLYQRRFANFPKVSAVCMQGSGA